MRIIRAADHRRVPWKNGLGMTREVLLAPDPGDPAQFLWRISIATVANAGPFSRFAGIDRSIAVLDGEGMRLLVEGEAVTLGPHSAPFRFSGDLDVQSEMIGGETTDLNAMTRRDAFVHEMRRLRCDGGMTVTGRAAMTLLIFNGAASVSGKTLDASVARLDAVADIGRGESLQVRADEPCDVLLIALDPAE